MKFSLRTFDGAYSHAADTYLQECKGVGTVNCQIFASGVIRMAQFVNWPLLQLR